MENLRTLETSITTELGGQLTYDRYLRLEQLLAAQMPLSDPPQHDELLFIIQHQTSELWMKLLIHELRSAKTMLGEGRADVALKNLSRVKHIQRQLFEQWAVLETLTPSEYLQFRHVLGPSSGFQSLQYRTIEFMLGNKNADMVRVFAHAPEQQRELESVLRAPSLYDQFLSYLAGRGHPVPLACYERDFAEPHQRHDGLIPVYKRIYENPRDDWTAYHLCEQLVDVEEGFQLWRFRHMKTVERIIGYRRGTGGSSGVAFLKRALDLSFFPELLEVRSYLQEQAPAKLD